MCRKFFKVLFSLTENEDGLSPGERQILDRLDRIEKKLDKQEKNSTQQFLFSLGVAFVIAALGVALAAADIIQINIPGLIEVLLFGGVLLIYWSPVVFQERFNKKLGYTGTILISISILVTFFIAPLSALYFLFLPSLIAMIIGFIMLVLSILLLKRK